MMTNIVDQDDNLNLNGIVHGGVVDSKNALMNILGEEYKKYVKQIDLMSESLNRLELLSDFINDSMTKGESLDFISKIRSITKSELKMSDLNEFNFGLDFLKNNCPTKGDFGKIFGDQNIFSIVMQIFLSKLKESLSSSGSFDETEIKNIENKISDLNFNQISGLNKNDFGLDQAKFVSLVDLLYQVNINIEDLLKKYFSDHSIPFDFSNIDLVDHKSIINSLLKLPIYGTFYNNINTIQVALNEIDSIYTIPTFSPVLSEIINELEKSNTNFSSEFKSSKNNEDVSSRNQQQLDILKNYVDSLPDDNKVKKFFGSISPDFQKLNKADKDIAQKYLDVIVNNWFCSEKMSGLLRDHLDVDHNGISNYQNFISSLFDLSKNKVKLGNTDIIFSKKDFKFFSANNGETIDVNSISGLNDISILLKLEVDLSQNEKVNDFFQVNFPDKFYNIGDLYFAPTQKIKLIGGGEIEGYPYLHIDNSGKSYLSLFENPNSTNLDEALITVDVDLYKKDYELSILSNIIELDNSDIQRLIFLNCIHDSFSKENDEQRNKLLQKANEIYLGKLLNNNPTLSQNHKKAKEEVKNYTEKNTKNNEIEDDAKILDDFASQFYNFHGDKTMNFDNFSKLKDTLKGGGIVLYFRLGEASSYGDGSTWVKMTFLEIDERNMTFKVKLSGSDVDLGSYEDKEVEFKLHPNQIANRKAISYGYCYKLNKINSIVDFGTYVKNVNLTSNWRSMEEGKNKWKELSYSNEQVKNSKNENITHIGKAIKLKGQNGSGNTDYYFAYEVAFGYDRVTVTNKESKYKKVMDYNSFYIFTTEKNLDPLTQDEVKNNKVATEQSAGSGSMPMNLMSIGALIKSFKMIKDNLMKKINDEDEMRKYKFYSRFLDSSAFKVIGGAASVLSFGLLNEAFGELSLEADTRLDERLMQMINDNKKKLGREGSVSPTKVSEKIEKDVFKNSNIYKSNPLKAAGYLLFALEGGGRYFRLLSGYSGKGQWVLALLGPDHQTKFLAKFSSLLTKLNNNPTDMKLAEELVKAEINYIKSCVGDPKYFGIFGSQFVATLDIAFNDLNSSGKISKVEDGAKAKTNFSDVYDDYIGALKNHRIPESLGNLGALTEKIADDSDYNKWFASMLMPLLSGFAKFNYVNNSKKRYGNLAFSNGFSLGLYVREANGPDKVVKLIDHICKNIGLSDKLFSKSIGWSSYRKNLLNGQIGDEKALSKLVDNIESWWGENGDKITNILNLEDIGSKSMLLSDAVNEKVDPEMQGIITDYISNKLIKDSSQTFGFNDKAFDNAVQYSRALFNLPSGLVKKVMLSIDSSGRFNQGEGEALWLKLDEKLGGLLANPNMDKASFEFVFNKFYEWFNDQFGGNQLLEFASALDKSKNMNSKEAQDMLMKIAMDVFQDKRGFYSKRIPRVMETAIKNYIKLFVKNKNYLTQDVIKGAFGQEILNDIDSYNRTTSNQYENLKTLITPEKFNELYSTIDNHKIEALSNFVSDSNNQQIVKQIFENNSVTDLSKWMNFDFGHFIQTLSEKDLVLFNTEMIRIKTTDGYKNSLPLAA